MKESERELIIFHTTLVLYNFTKDAIVLCVFPHKQMVNSCIILQTSQSMTFQECLLFYILVQSCADEKKFCCRTRLVNLFEV